MQCAQSESIVCFIVNSFLRLYSRHSLTAIFARFFYRVRKESSDEQYKFSSVILHFTFCILHLMATTGRRYGYLTVSSVILHFAFCIYIKPKLFIVKIIPNIVNIENTLVHTTN